MDDSEIRRRIVRRLWNDDILQKIRMADIDTVTDLAVPSSDEGRARDLIKNEMVSDSSCPVVWGIGGQAITLKMDRELVARYLLRHGGEESLPWDLRDALAAAKEEEVAAETTDAR